MEESVQMIDNQENFYSDSPFLSKNRQTEIDSVQFSEEQRG